VQLGATILHETVLWVAVSGDRVTAIRTGERIIASDEVVLATSPWVAIHKSWLGIDLAVQPVKG
jgi:glycine/D-amino acid oxidase-like deaminating enzyme